MVRNIYPQADIILVILHTLLTSNAQADLMEILFINANKELSKKEEESQNSYARSHAARVVAARIASARTKAQVNAKRGPVFKSVTRKHAVVPSDHLPLASSEAVVRHVVGYKALTEPPVYPGFGSFRGELFDILPSGTHIEDLRALDFFTQVTLPDMDVVNEMFDQLSLSGQFLPCLVSSSRHAFQSPTSADTSPCNHDYFTH